MADSYIVMRFAFCSLVVRSPVVSGPRLLPTAHCLLSFSLDWLIADFAHYLLAGWKFKIQDLAQMIHVAPASLFIYCICSLIVYNTKK